MISLLLSAFTLVLGALAQTTTDPAAAIPTLSPVRCTATYNTFRLSAVRDDTRAAYPVRLIPYPDDTRRNVTHMVVNTASTTTSPCPTAKCGIVPSSWDLTKNVLTARLPSTPSGWITANLDVSVGTSPSFVTSPSPVKYPIYCAQSSSLSSETLLMLHGTAKKFWMCDLTGERLPNPTQFTIIYDISTIRPSGPCYSAVLRIQPLFIVDPPPPVTLYNE